MGADGGAQGLENMQVARVEAIRQRYREILGRAGEAALRAGRKPDSFRVVAVTKAHPVETLRATLQAGVTEIGENYAEEAVEKMQALGETPRVHWHMIGHVQSRKAGLVAKYFAWMHSLDSTKLAGRLDRAAQEAGRVLPVLLECNVSGEASKFGLPAWDAGHWTDVHGVAEQVHALPGISLRGLMTMPPYTEVAEQSRPFFQRLRALRDYLQEQLPALSLDELSMGTSADFVCAVEEGATLLRIGTAIVGPRVGG